MSVYGLRWDFLLCRPPFQLFDAMPQVIYDIEQNAYLAVFAYFLPQLVNLSLQVILHSVKLLKDGVLRAGD